MARTVSVIAPAMLFAKGAGSGFAVAPGYALNPADRIDTRGGGRVVISFTDGSLVIIQPESIVTIKDYRAAGSLRELFDITVGIVRVKINHFAGKPNPYRMNTPTASVAVRGTEFEIGVDDPGDTRVDVFEGAVQVTALDDPARSALVEGGYGIQVRRGDFRTYPLRGAGPGIAQQREPRGPDDPPPPEQARDRAPRPPAPPDVGSTPREQALIQRPGPILDARADPKTMPVEAHSGAAMQPARIPPRAGQGEGVPRTGGTTEAAAPTPAQLPPALGLSTYDRYLATLGSVSQLAFGTRYSAIPDPHLESIENPAYAAGFTRMETRAAFMPLWSGGSTPVSAVAPQVSIFAPAGRWVAGGSANFYRATGAGDWLTSFSTANAVLAARMGSGGNVGVGIERLSGSGEEGLLGTSNISQVRLSVGYTLDTPGAGRFGLFYRYGRIGAANAGPAAPASVRGRSDEAGARFRAAISPKLYYAASVYWSSASVDQVMNRKMATFGLAYLPDHRTMLAFDAGFAQARVGAISDRVPSFHAALRRDLTRKLFADVSFVETAGRYSDFGLGWRFTSGLTAQYLYSTDYGKVAGIHAIVFRYTFRRGSE